MRGFVGAGDDVMIGGFIVADVPGAAGAGASEGEFDSGGSEGSGSGDSSARGSDPGAARSAAHEPTPAPTPGTRRILVSGIGPDLTRYGVTGTLSSPTLRLHSGSRLIEFNDNWRTSSRADEIEATGLAPSDMWESAILADLPPGAYTAILAGTGAEIGLPQTGAALLQVFDLGATDAGASDAASDITASNDDRSAAPRLVNLSTRARVGTGERGLIAGWILEGEAPRRVVVRGLGPTLARMNPPVAGVLEDPELTVLSGETVLETNGNWLESPDAIPITALGLAPHFESEAALMIDLPPGAYTGILSGAAGGEGAGLIEVYAVE